MAKLRNIACEHYICETKCSLSKEGTFWKKCQKCKSYKPVSGGTPIKIDNHKKKIEQERMKDLRDWL